MTTWIQQAACRNGTRHPDTWHSTNPDEQAEARAVCQACPVVAPCRTAVMAAEAGFPAAYRHGIQGALDSLERAALDPTTPTRPARELKECGTDAAKRRHLRKNETCTRCGVGVKAVTR